MLRIKSIIVLLLAAILFGCGRKQPMVGSWELSQAVGSDNVVRNINPVGLSKAQERDYEKYLKDNPSLIIREDGTAKFLGLSGTWELIDNENIKLVVKDDSGKLRRIFMAAKSDDLGNIRIRYVKSKDVLDLENPHGGQLRLRRVSLSK